MPELRCLYAPEDAKCDVVFVHGLGGELMETWNLPVSWVPWLQRDFPSAQLWTLGYDAAPTAWFGGHAMPLQDRAVNLLAELNGYGVGTCGPLVLICHSLGGLLAKQLLRIGDGNARQFQSTARAVAGIAFLATPHSGASLPVIADYLRALTRRTVAVADLQENAGALRDLNAWFRDKYASAPMPMRVFYETRQTAGFRIVSESSADPGIPGIEPIPVDADHISICKPAAPNLVYRQTASMLREIVTTPAPDSRESSLRKQLLVAVGHEEIQRIQFELQTLMKRDPASFGTHQLLAKAEDALKYARPRLQRRASDPPDLTIRHARRGEYPVRRMAAFAAVLLAAVAGSWLLAAYNRHAQAQLEAVVSESNRFFAARDRPQATDGQMILKQYEVQLAEQQRKAFEEKLAQTMTAKEMALERERAERRMKEERERRVATTLPPPRAPVGPAAPAPAVQAGDLVEIGPGVIPARNLTLPNPPYPEIAKRAKKGAVVTVAVLVNENGQPIDVRLLDPKPAGFGFDKAALDAVRRATFSPATKDGVRVKMWTKVVLTFAP